MGCKLSVPRFCALPGRGMVSGKEQAPKVSNRLRIMGNPKYENPYVPRCEYAEGDGGRTAEFWPDAWCGGFGGHSGGCNGGHAPAEGERPCWPVGESGGGEPAAILVSAVASWTSSMPKLGGAGAAPELDPEAPGVDTRRAGSRPVGPLPRGCRSLGGRASICLRRAFSVSRTSMRSSSAERCCLRRARNAR